MKTLLFCKVKNSSPMKQRDRHTGYRNRRYKGVYGPLNCMDAADPEP